MLEALLEFIKTEINFQFLCILLDLQNINEMSLLKCPYIQNPGP